MWLGGGGGTLIIIPRCGPDAFYRVRILEGMWGLSPCMGSGVKPVAKIVLGHSKELK